MVKLWQYSKAKEKWGKIPLNTCRNKLNSWLLADCNEFHEYFHSLLPSPPIFYIFYLVNNELYKLFRLMHDFFLNDFVIFSLNAISIF